MKVVESMSEASLDDILADLDRRREKMFAIQTELQKEAEQFKAIMKARFGATDGEQTSILDLVKVIKTVTAMK